MDSVRGLEGKCAEVGVTVLSGVEVTGFEEAADGSISAVETSAGRIEVGEQVVIAPGPWAKRFWAMLGMPETIDVRTPSGDLVRDRPMWTYWNLQEGEVGMDPMLFATADGGPPPVIHLDTDAPLVADDGKVLSEELWGIYFKRDRHSVQGGASPLVVETTSCSIRTRRRRTSTRTSPTSSAPGCHTRWHVSRGAARCTSRRAPAESGRSPWTTSRSSTTSARTCTRSSTRTTATR